MASDSERNASYADVVLKRIQENRKIPEENRKAAASWAEFLRAKGATKSTISKHIFCFEKFLLYLPAGVKLSKAKTEHIQSALVKIMDSDYAPETKNNIKVVIKAFYKHYKGEDMLYPREVAWIKTTFKKKKMLPDDMLNEDEIFRMINAVNNPRDKAIISVLYDSGIRVGELMNMKLKDLDLEGEPQHITVDGKTGQRRIPIQFSAPYLSSYVEMVKSKKPNDFLWTAQGSWSNMNWQLDESGIRKVLREAAKKAGIDKRIYPHLFRHSRASFYANRITEQQLKAYFGWSGDSRMVSTYVHMSGRDIDDAILQAHGKKPKEAIMPKLTEKICPRCRWSNGIDFVHCKKCGAPLDPVTLMKTMEVAGDARKSMLDSVGDKELFDDFVKYMAKRKKEKK